MVASVGAVTPVGGFSGERRLLVWATVPPGFEPGLRAWGFLSKR